MEAPASGVVEGGLPERATGTELEQPARVERAASSLAPFGRVEPVVDGVTCGVALGAPLRPSSLARVKRHPERRVEGRPDDLGAPGRLVAGCLIYD